MTMGGTEDWRSYARDSMRNTGGGTPPKKGCGGKKKMFGAAFIMLFVFAGSLSQAVNVIRTLA